MPLRVPSSSSLSVVLPVYNEAEDLSQFIHEVAEVVRSLTDNYELIVVNDGSTDDTTAVLEELGHRISQLRVVSHQTNRGYGHALRAGISAASCDLTLLMDADGQFPPSEIAAVFGAMSGTDCILGVRIARRDPLYRRILGYVGNWLAGWLLRERMLDVNYGIKLFKTSDLKQMELRSGGGLISTEILLNLLSSHRRIRQVTVDHRPRVRERPTGGRLLVITKILTFPISEFGLCSCGFLVHPL